MKKLMNVWVTGVVEPKPLEMLKGKANVVVRNEPTTIPAEEYLALVGKFDIIISVMHAWLDDDVIARAPKLKGFVNRGVGVNHIDLKAATKAGIACTNTPGVLVNATADHAVGLIIAGARLYGEGGINARTDRWLWSQALLVGQPIYGRTLGIIGMGPIGQRVARTMRLGFGMNILYWSRSRKLHLENDPVLGFQYCELEKLLSRSDIISLHCALAQETERIIDARSLSLMKPTSVLVNTGRGALVDQPALIEAVLTKKIFAAALDCTDPEPPSADDPILNTPQIFVTPHIGSGDTAGREGMTRLAIENALDIIESRRPRSILNPEIYR